jgi:hypothetical protein
MKSGGRLGVFLTTLSVAAQFGSQGPDLIDVDVIVQKLNNKSRQLIDAVKLLEKDLDQAITACDPADSALSTDRNLKLTSTRKLMLARMIASQTREYNPSPISDAVRVQDLIVETRQLIDEADSTNARLLLISVRTLDRREAGESKKKRQLLSHARTSSQDAVKRGFASLPIDLSIIQSPGEPGVPARIKWERQRRITLVREKGYRVALTDPGMEDPKGRHLFYQEEWIQRWPLVSLLRWRVVVDAVACTHSVLKAYPQIARRGELDEAYKDWQRDSLWRIEPPNDVAEPSKAEIESALVGLQQRRLQLRSAIQEYGTRVAAAVDSNDQRQTRDGEAVPDFGQDQRLRQKLFAIRAQMARVPWILDARAKLQTVIDDLAQSVRNLESLASWGNRATPNHEYQLARISLSDWETLQKQSEDQLDMAFLARKEAANILPPDFSVPEAKFPALRDDSIIRIQRQPAGALSVPALRCLQEIWNFQSVSANTRHARRVVSLIDVNPKSGVQAELKRVVVDYDAGPNELLEAIFDRYAAQEVITQNQ